MDDAVRRAKRHCRRSEEMLIEALTDNEEAAVLAARNE